MTNYGDWRPATELFEAAGVVFSHSQEDDMKAYHYTAKRKDLTIPRVVYVLGDRESFLTLLAHWNKQGEWRYDEQLQA